MKRAIITCLLALLISSVHAQSKTEALAEFDWLTGFVQRNYPGYTVKTKKGKSLNGRDVPNKCARQ